MNRETAYMTAAAICWLALLWSTYQGVQQSGSRRMHQVIFTRRLLLLFALTITCRIRAVHTLLTTVTHINNLALLFSYGSGVVAVYNVVRYLQLRLLSNNGISRLRVLFWCTLLAMAAVFPQVALGPDLYQSDAGSSPAIFLFRQLFYLYAAGVCAVAAAGFQHMQHTDLTYPCHLRWLTGKLGMIAAVFYCLIRMMETNLHRWGIAAADGFTAQVLHLISPITFVVGTLLWSLFFAGGRFFQALTGLARYRGGVQTLCALSAITAKTAISGLHQVPIRRPVWWFCRHDVDFHIYRAVISLMDNKKLLKAWLYPAPGHEAAHLVPRDRQQAETLYALLDAVECQEQTDYPCLVMAYRQIGKQYQQGQFNE